MIHNTKRTRLNQLLGCKGIALKTKKRLSKEYQLRQYVDSKYIYTCSMHMNCLIVTLHHYFASTVCGCVHLDLAKGLVKRLVWGRVDFLDIAAFRSDHLGFAASSKSVEGS